MASAVHARDIAVAFLVALEAPIQSVHALAYNGGIEWNKLTVAEIAQSMVEVVPGAKCLGEAIPAAWMTKSTRSTPLGIPVPMSWTSVVISRVCSRSWIQAGTPRKKLSTTTIRIRSAFAASRLWSMLAR